jgi:predicted enzyme related to lactoylglutathione lyase
MVARDDNKAANGELGIGGGVGQGPEGYDGHVTFYVAVPDVEEALQKAESLGGTRVMGPENIMDTVTLGQFKDPEGNMVGVVQDMPAGG